MSKRTMAIIAVLVVVGILGTASVALARGGARMLGERGMMGVGDTVRECDESCEQLANGEGVLCDGECDGECDGAGEGTCDSENCTQDQDGTCAGEGEGVGAGRGQGGGLGRTGACGR